MVPADMYSVLAAELMIWSMACIAKLKVMNSTTGRNPAIAAPQLIPVNPAWAIVVEAQQSRAETGGFENVCCFMYKLLGSCYMCC